MKAHVRFLKEVPLFRGLSGHDLAALERIALREDARKGHTIFSPSARGDALYVVVKGTVKIFGRSRTGKMKTFAYLEAGDFFGEMALLGGGIRSAGAMALTPALLLTVRRKDFQDLLARRPQTSFALLRALCERLSRADREIESLSFNSVLGRTARILLDLAGRYGRKTASGTRIARELSHRELAQMAGTAREMISRVLARLMRTGCLATDGKCLTVKDAAKLKGWIL